MSHPDKGKGLRSESQQRFVKLTDAAVERVELPAGKSQIYLYDTEQPGLALRVRASGGRSWVFLFTKPGVDGTQRKTLGAWPRFKEKDARAAAKIATGDLVALATRTLPSVKPDSNSWPQKSGRRRAS